VSQIRYVLGEDSSEPLVGGRPVGMEINIVTLWGMCSNLDVELLVWK
jgi:hypothetical protein